MLPLTLRPLESPSTPSSPSWRHRLIPPRQLDASATMTLTILACIHHHHHRLDDLSSNTPVAQTTQVCVLMHHTSDEPRVVSPFRVGTIPPMPVLPPASSETTWNSTSECHVLAFAYILPILPLVTRSSKHWHRAPLQTSQHCKHRTPEADFLPLRGAIEHVVNTDTDGGVLVPDGGCPGPDRAVHDRSGE
ncbi:hypothetical protein OH76DRAFT_429691 [Lentinus brumalis]|uniref:Uncharacterized protein n=1 Tax=Lentinus brumalis TaxID=2498619 RepID=A0A371DDI0_9APHY|nr:hypothetical protein OH76DRAFT_429691 [Polyporus brumalis]